MAKQPSKKQKELFDFIDTAIKTSGYAPSYREIMRALDYKSVSTVATHIDGLIQKGWLAKKDRSARSLIVISEEEKVVNKKNIDDHLAWLREEADKEGVSEAHKKILRDAIEVIERRRSS